MKKLIELIKTYKLQILIFLTVIFFFRSCSNSSKVTKLEKIEKQNVAMIDSLKIKHKNEKIAIHSFYDNWITQKDRGQQLMELHFIVKENLKKEQESK
mgnify:CR=1 FL=1|jgi:hypothetical protein